MTWLPFPSISKSVIGLSQTKLDRTWDVSYGVLRTVLGCRNPIDTPLVRLWRGWETALANYTWNVMAEQQWREPDRELFEWILFSAIVEDAPRIQASKAEVNTELIQVSTKTLKTEGYLPPWFGWRPLHESHKKALFTGDMSSLVYPWSFDGTLRAPVFQGRQGSGAFRT